MMDRPTTDQTCPVPLIVHPATSSNIFDHPDTSDSAGEIAAKRAANADTSVGAVSMMAAAVQLSREAVANMGNTSIKHLPPLEIKDPAFDAIATSMMSRLDVDENGRVTRDELKDFIDHPTKFDKQSTRDAVQLMYDNYQFLRELSPSPDGRFAEHSPGINVIGIHRAFDLANGRGVAADRGPLYGIGTAVGAAGMGWVDKYGQHSSLEGHTNGTHGSGGSGSGGGPGKHHAGKHQAGKDSHPVQSNKGQ